MMLPARTGSIARVNDISRDTVMSIGCTDVDATAPMANHVSVLVEDKLRKSISVCLKKFGVLVLKVEVLDSVWRLGVGSLNRLSAADGIGAPKSNVCALTAFAPSAVITTKDISVVRQRLFSTCILGPHADVTLR